MVWHEAKNEKQKDKFAQGVTSTAVSCDKREERSSAHAADERRKGRADEAFNDEQKRRIAQGAAPTAEKLEAIRQEKTEVLTGVAASEVIAAQLKELEELKAKFKAKSSEVSESSEKLQRNPHRPRPVVSSQGS